MSAASSPPTAALRAPPEPPSAISDGPGRSRGRQDERAATPPEGTAPDVARRRGPPRSPAAPPGRCRRGSDALRAPHRHREGSRAAHMRKSVRRRSPSVFGTTRGRARRRICRPHWIDRERCRRGQVGSASQRHPRSRRVPGFASWHRGRSAGDAVASPSNGSPARTLDGPPQLRPALIEARRSPAGRGGWPPGDGECGRARPARHGCSRCGRRRAKVPPDRSTPTQLGSCAASRVAQDRRRVGRPEIGRGRPARRGSRTAAGACGAGSGGGRVRRAAGGRGDARRPPASQRRPPAPTSQVIGVTWRALAPPPPAPVGTPGDAGPGDGGGRNGWPGGARTPHVRARTNAPAFAGPSGT